MHQEREEQRDDRAAMRPEHSRSTLLALEQNQAERDGHNREPRSYDARNRDPLKQNLQHHVRNQDDHRAKPEEPVILDQELHDLLVSGAELVFLWQLHHPVTIDPLDKKVRNRDAK